MAEQKIFIGRGWKREFANGGSVINIKVNLTELNKLAPNQYGDIALVVGERKTPDEKTKATHNVTVDTYVHKQDGEEKAKVESNQLPF